MRIVYICTEGSSDPTKATLPWHLAVNGSLAEDQDPVMVLAGNATDLVVGDTVAAVKGVGVPPLEELVSTARRHEVPVFV